MSCSRLSMFRCRKLRITCQCQIAEEAEIIQPLVAQERLKPACFGLQTFLGPFVRNIEWHVDSLAPHELRPSWRGLQGTSGQ